MRPVDRGFSRALRLAQSLPRVDEGTAWGSRAVKVDGQMFACIAIHRSAEPGTLVVRVPVAERDELIASAPDIYYLTDHYVDYPSVLVRLDRIADDALRDLLAMAWRFTVANGMRRRRPAKAQHRRTR
jgi:hypothetical protein